MNTLILELKLNNDSTKLDQNYGCWNEVDEMNSKMNLGEP